MMPGDKLCPFDTLSQSEVTESCCLDINVAHFFVLFNVLKQPKLVSH